MTLIIYCYKINILFFSQVNTPFKGVVMTHGTDTDEAVQALDLLQQVYIAASEFHNIELRDSLANGSLQEVAEALDHSMNDLEHRNGHTLSDTQERELHIYTTLSASMKRLSIVLTEHKASLEDFAARDVLNGKVPLYMR